jgi:hypothetical protein
MKKKIVKKCKKDAIDYKDCLDKINTLLEQFELFQKKPLKKSKDIK